MYDTVTGEWRPGHLDTKCWKSKKEIRLCLEMLM